MLDYHDSEPSIQVNPSDSFPVCHFDDPDADFFSESDGGDLGYNVCVSSPSASIGQASQRLSYLSCSHVVSNVDRVVEGISNFDTDVRLDLEGSFPSPDLDEGQCALMPPSCESECWSGPPNSDSPMGAAAPDMPWSGRSLLGRNSSSSADGS